MRKTTYMSKDHQTTKNAIEFSNILRLNFEKYAIEF